MTLPTFSNEVSFLVKQPKVIDGGESYTVSVTIQKQAISGISKFEVDLPEGFAIRAIETSGSRFIKQSNIGKFIWLNLPNADELTIVYQIYVPINVEMEYRLSSTFFYLEGKEKKSSTYTSFMDAENNFEDLTLKELNSILLLNPDLNIYFKVQLGAFEKSLNTGKIQSYFNVQNEINVDFVEGMHKYTVGPFNDYFDATEFQESCKVKGAFLVLYFIDVKVSKDDAIKIIRQ